MLKKKLVAGQQAKAIRKPSPRRSERGASMLEYALLVGLITVIAIAAVRVFGQKVSTQFSKVATQV